jgi:uncharacterized integral membrane protein
VGRIVYWITVIIATAIIVAFAATNLDTISLNFWLFPNFVENVPVFAVVLGAALIGFICGGIIAWLSGGRARRRARTLARQLERLERDYEGLQDKLDRASETERAAEPADATSDEDR